MELGNEGLTVVVSHEAIVSSWHVDRIGVGHDEKRTAASCESLDLEYLADCVQATESIPRHAKRPPCVCKAGADGGWDAAKIIDVMEFGWWA